ncbi:PaaI family thioesterase [Ferrimonas balearica]|uniref:PaaI family thioesterase n=1 Tax=Ferrimonas balearica TaxID=44012 RepID=UPI001C99B17A|nr:PaaI family thioesterase [Ferrimonas balearica]MBY5992415.1 PaaI family thioesterase [Ferrimonas balearica]
MTMEEHHRRLEQMYLSAPINDYYRPSIQVADGEAEISIELAPKYFHAAGAVHGSVYFKMLDDVCFFAANSREREVFVLTTAFTTYLTRPISQGRLSAVGRVVNQNRSQFICEAVAYNDGKEVARGNGVFVRSKVALEGIPSYARRPTGAPE